MEATNGEISSFSALVARSVASSKHVSRPQLNNIMLTIANVNQDTDTILKQDKSEQAVAPLGPIVTTPVLVAL